MAHEASSPHLDLNAPVPCPRCGEPLGHPDFGAFEDFAGRPCSGLNGCGGAWYGHRAFESLKREAAEDGKLNSHRTRPPRSPAPAARGTPEIACPECGDGMEKRHFRFEGRTTPIVLDECEAHGLWFDARELDATLEVVREHARAMERHRSNPLKPMSPDVEESKRGPITSEAVANLRAAQEKRRDRNRSRDSRARKRKASSSFFDLGDLLEIFVEGTADNLFSDF